MTASNALTLVRAVISPLVYTFAVIHWAGFAIAIYAIGLLTDFLDGIIARTFQTQSPFGRAMDSTADKMLVFSGLLALKVPAWLLLLFVMREFFTFGLRAIHPDDGRSVADINDTIGRARFFVLHVGILILLLPGAWIFPRLKSVGFVIVIVAIFIGWAASAFYIYRDWAIIRATFRKDWSKE